jgi:hypothetical protein
MLSTALILFKLLGAVPASAQEPSTACQSIQNLSPEEFIATDLDDLQKSGAVLKWAPIENTAKYHIEISRTESFERIVHVERKKNIFPVRAYLNKTYFWKVKAFDENKQLLSCPIGKPFHFVIIAESSEPNSSTVETLTESIESAPEPELPDPKLLPPAKAEQNLIATPTNTVLPFEKTEAEVSSNSPRISLVSGVGLLNFSQTNSEIGSVKSSGILFPSLGIAGQTGAFGRFFFAGHLQQTNGKFSSDNSTISLVDSQFQWQRYGASAFMQVHPKWFISFGLEQITTPYFFALSPSIMTLKVINQSNASIGVVYDFYKSKKWNYSFQGTYSHPLSAKGDGLTSAKISGMQLDFNLKALHYTSRGMFWGWGITSSYRNLTQSLNSVSFVSSGNATTKNIGLDITGGILF